MYSKESIDFVRKKISELFSVLAGQSQMGKTISTIASPMLAKLEEQHIVKIIDFLIDLTSEVMEREYKNGDITDN